MQRAYAKIRTRNKSAAKRRFLFETKKLVSKYIVTYNNAADFFI